MKPLALLSLLRSLLGRIGRITATRRATTAALEMIQPGESKTPRSVKIAWAVGITATILGELLFRCDGPLHPLTALALKQANLAIICPPPPVVVPVPVLRPPAPALPSAVPQDQAPGS